MKRISRITFIGMILFGLGVCFSFSPPLPTVTTVVITGNDTYHFYGIKVQMAGYDSWDDQWKSSTYEHWPGPRDPEWFPANYLYWEDGFVIQHVWVKETSSSDWEDLGAPYQITGKTVYFDMVYFYEFDLDDLFAP